MKRSMIAVPSVAATVAILCLAVAGPAMAGFIEEFTDDEAGWNYGYGSDFNSPLLAATYLSSGGNPGGCITGAASNLYAVWVWNYDPVPVDVAALYGDMTGLSLTIDTKITEPATGNAQFYVGRGGAYFIDGAWAISADTNWHTHTVPLDAAHFTRWTGKDTGAYTLGEVLQAPDDVGIFFGGGLASGAGALLVDNFGTVPIPEPGTLVLLALGGLTALAAGWIHRRRGR